MLREQISKILTLGMSHSAIARGIGISGTTFDRWYKHGQALTAENEQKIQDYVYYIKNYIAQI